MGTQITFIDPKDPGYAPGVIVVKENADAQRVYGILTTNGYAVNLRGHNDE